MEAEQALEEQTAEGKAGKRFMDIHMYFTQALQKTDMRAVGLQVALDLLYKKVSHSLVVVVKTDTYNITEGAEGGNKIFDIHFQQTKTTQTLETKLIKLNLKSLFIQLVLPSKNSLVMV